jgi:hypothetical protein
MSDEQKIQLLNELFEWNKWQIHAIDLNDIQIKEYTHGEGVAYIRGQTDYGIMIAVKLNTIKKQLEETK